MFLFLLFLVVRVQLLLHWLYLRLYVVEGPLLWLLHLNHHFLDLLELLETVSLHLLKLLLLRHQHVQSSFLLAKEGVLYCSAVVAFALDRQSWSGTLWPAVVKRISWPLPGWMSAVPCFLFSFLSCRIRLQGYILTRVRFLLLHISRSPNLFACFAFLTPSHTIRLDNLLLEALSSLLLIGDSSINYLFLSRISALHILDLILKLIWKRLLLWEEL